jgi:hypothetical protein
MKLCLQHQHIVIVIIRDNQDLIKHNNNHGQPYSKIIVLQLGHMELLHT